MEPEIISDIYFEAWKEKLKGVTIYREGSRFPILSTVEESTEFQKLKEQKYTINQEDGSEKEVSGDEVIKLPNGALTTVYHYLYLSQKEGKEPMTIDKKQGINV